MIHQPISVREQKQIMEKKRVLVIGAGACGLAAIKSCKEEGLDVVCYDKTNDVGGLWRYTDTVMDGVASVMKTTITNSSREMTSYSDFPMPRHYPLYVPHEMMLRYLELYAEHFDLKDGIQFQTEVLKVLPAESYDTTGRWVVQSKKLDEEIVEETFDAVMVCTGHHFHPNMPSYKDLDIFKGVVLHSHAYRTFKGFENKSVVVIGAGSSGSDIAVELAKVAKTVYLSTRNGAWIFPRNLRKGKPFDITFVRRYRIDFRPRFLVERQLRNWLTSIFDYDRFGITPKHPPLNQHPTINGELKNCLLSGKVKLRKDVVEFTENAVKFVGEDDHKTVDVVIFATGYHVTFPFLNEVLVEQSNRVKFYKNVFPPNLKHLSLGVLGMIQPYGSLIPVFEIQARWFVSLIAGKCHIPSCTEMEADVKKFERFRRRNFNNTDRHAIEYYWLPYIDGIADLIGAKPNLLKLMFTDPKLFWVCLTGPCLPYQFRLFGSHQWSFAREYLLQYKYRNYAISDE